MAYHTFNHCDHFASLQPMLIPPSIPEPDLNHYHHVDQQPIDGAVTTGVDILASTPVSYSLLSRSNPIDISMPLYHPLPLDPNHLDPTPFTTTYSSPPYAYSPPGFVTTTAPTPDFVNYQPDWDMTLQLFASPSATPASSAIDLVYTRDSSPADMFKVDFDFPSPQPATTFEFVNTADFIAMSQGLPTTTGIDYNIPSDFIPSPEPHPMLSTVASPQPLPTFVIGDLINHAQESPKPAFEFYQPDLISPPQQLQRQRTYEFINEDPSANLLKTFAPAPPSTAAPLPLRRSLTSRSSTSSASSARSSPPTHSHLPNISTIVTSSILDPTTVALTLVDALPSVLAFSPATAPPQYSTAAPVDIFRCHECKQSFPTLQQLRQHVKSHSPTFPSLERSNDSLTAAAAAAAAALPKKFECAECGKCFTRKQDFVRHQHTHVEGFKPYECGNCGMRFSRSDALSRHYRRKICRE